MAIQNSRVNERRKCSMIPGEHKYFDKVYGQKFDSKASHYVCVVY
jgi:hypothetical protein